ncbi:aspartate aminotransferase [Deltaproteobacteria bacterium]|nr:aspartate aminotransferase [Deltaproteobacteria bacterium]
MTAIEEKFAEIAADNAPGQEERNLAGGTAFAVVGDNIPGRPVDFSHGDVDAFTPTPGAFELFSAGVAEGGSQAYTVYRGKAELRADLAAKLTKFTGAPVNADKEIIITTGTQGALFLAVASVVTAGDKIVIVQPDYFANRKIVRFLGAEVMPVRLNYLGKEGQAGLDLAGLEKAFKAGAKAFLFSNPNNPAGVIFSEEEIRAIARLAEQYQVTVIVDELYSRLIYDGRSYTHLRTAGISPDRVLTIIGPSKTESLSGYRLGVAFGAGQLIDRMEKLQAIVSLRAAGYCQAVLKTWFAEPEGWMAERVLLHQNIRDDLVRVLRTFPDVVVRPSEAGSYLFPQLPPLRMPIQDFARILRQQAAVTVTPGTEFAPHTTDSVRLNFSQDHRAAVDAVKRMGVILDRYRK